MMLAVITFACAERALHGGPHDYSRVPAPGDRDCGQRLVVVRPLDTGVLALAQAPAVVRVDFRDFRDAGGRARP